MTEPVNTNGEGIIGPLIMTLLVRNEADIVRQNIEFHLSRGVNHIIATDNQSTDGTTEILEEFARRGILTLFHEPSDEYLQKQWVNRMVGFAIERFGPAWLLNNDADEFWRPPNTPGGGAGSLKEVVAKATSPLISCRRTNLFASTIETNGVDWANSLVWRSRIASPPNSQGLPKIFPKLHPFFCYRVPQKVIVHSGGLLEVGKGAHTATFSKRVHEENLGVEIFHYPVRSAEEFCESVLRISDSLKFNQGLLPSQSSKYAKWRRVYDKTGSRERLLKEAVPGPFRLKVYRLAGLVTKDTRMRDDLVALEEGFLQSPLWNSSKTSVPTL